MSFDSFGSRATLTVDGRAYTIYRLDSLNSLAGSKAAKLPVTLKVLLENLLRNEDDAFVKASDIETLAKWDTKAGVEREIAFRTSRVLLQDFRLGGPQILAQQMINSFRLDLCFAYHLSPLVDGRGDQPLKLLGGTAHGR